ncbi:hypothetical protein H0H92_012226, partial [Tricholoma furcatifolium]
MDMDVMIVHKYLAQNIGMCILTTINVHEELFSPIVGIMKVTSDAEALSLM